MYFERTERGGKEYLQNYSVDGRRNWVAKKVPPRDRIVEWRVLIRRHREQLLPPIQVQREIGGLPRVVALGAEPHEDRGADALLLTEKGTRRRWSHRYGRKVVLQGSRAS